MKQVSAKLKNRGATAAVLMLALGAAVYLNWSFSREAPSSLVVSEDIAADAVETSAAVSEILDRPAGRRDCSRCRTRRRGTGR